MVQVTEVLVAALSTGQADHLADEAETLEDLPALTVYYEAVSRVPGALHSLIRS